MEAFQVTTRGGGRQPLHGSVRGRRGEEQRAEADGRLAARARPDDDHQRARHPRRGRDGTAPRGARLRGRPRPRHRPGRRSTCPRSSATTRRTTWCDGCAPSISVLGPLVARCGRAEVSLPGGDNIGSRGLDMHLRGLRDLGAQVEIEHGYVVAPRAKRLHGASLWLDFPSVGATENLVMAATARARHARSSTTSPASPRSSTSATCSWRWAPTSRGSGSSTLIVEGVGRLHPVEHATVDGPDRGRHLGLRDRHRRRRADRGGRGRRPPRHRAGQAGRGRRGGRRARGRLPRRGRPPARRLRRGDAALPRVPDRPAAVRDGAGRGERRAPR